MCPKFRCWHDPLSTPDPQVVGEGSSLTVQSTIADTYNGQTILITGGRGYIGSALAQALSHVYCHLILLDRSECDAWRPDHQRARVSIMTGDVSVPHTWETILPGVDYVFHLSGLEYTKTSDDGPMHDLRQNALPMLHLLEACRLHHWYPKIIFTSSVNLFGRATVMPVNEEHGDDPLIPWAIHKLMAERYLRLYTEQYGVKSTILRLANVYGPTARRAAMTRVVLNKMVADAMAGKPLTVYENHKCLRDYIYLEDVVRALLLAGTDTAALDGRLYVIGSGEGKLISDVCQQIVGQVHLRTGQQVQVNFDASVNIDAFEMRNFIADIRRFHSATGWKPRVALEQGINLTIESFMMAGTSA